MSLIISNKHVGLNLVEQWKMDKTKMDNEKQKMKMEKIT